MTGSIPKTLYQYRKINVNTLRSLIMDTVYMCNPKDFNDPYDSDFSLLNQKLAELRSEATGAFRHDTESQRELYRRQREEISKASKVLESYSVNCFTEVEPITQPRKQSEKTVLMWSHYADGHKGICLAFGTGKLGAGKYYDGWISIYELKPIRYDGGSEAPSFSLDDIDDIKNSVQKHFNEAMLSKAEFWAYEKEWRLIVDAGPHNFEYGPALELQAIYLGSKISRDDEKLIKEIVKGKGISVHNTVLDQKSYAINIKN